MATRQLTGKQNTPLNPNSRREDSRDGWPAHYGIRLEAGEETLITGSYRAEHRIFQEKILELTRELKGYKLPVTASDRAYALMSDIRERAEFLDSYLWHATSRVVSDIRSSQHTASLAENKTLERRLARLVRAVNFFQHQISGWENPALERLIKYHLDRLRVPAPTSSAAPAQ